MALLFQSATCIEILCENSDARHVSESCVTFAMASITRLLCARALSLRTHPAAYSHAEARESWQRVPDRAHTWTLDSPKAKPGVLERFYVCFRK